MGAGSWAGETVTYERNNDVYVRELAADIQYHDGLHDVQDTSHRSTAY